SHLQSVLHHETKRHGHGALDLPINHRRPWRSLVGVAACAVRDFLSIHCANGTAGRTIVRSNSLTKGSRRSRHGSLSRGPTVESTVGDVAVAIAEGDDLVALQLLVPGEAEVGSPATANVRFGTLARASPVRPR
ncbi:MAG: hypothetical protein QOG73_2890, partial [Acetobacteraceae bacterium]|nr:hypothetical protein [Acetobacteraceae bacterium]